jgi:tRNA G18 (ribose-2'-O)-methylase SpoU
VVFRRFVVSLLCAMQIYGINPVLEALRARRVTTIRVSSRADERVTAVIRLAGEQGIPVRRVSVEDLDGLTGGASHRHQGVVADVEGKKSVSVEDLVIGAQGAPLIVVLDSRATPPRSAAGRRRPRPARSRTSPLLRSSTSRERSRR